MTPTNRGRLRFFALIAILYFNQGFPFGIYDRTLNLYLSVEKVPLATIGLLSTVGLAWTLKLFWAPLVDAVGTYRAWIFGSLIAMALALATFAYVPAAGTVFWIAAAVLAFSSATQDIATDALSIRITPAERIGIVNSIRVTSARVAFIAAGGGLAILADRIAWKGAFLTSAIVPMIIIALIAVFVPREAGGVERHENPVRALLEWLGRERALMLLAVVLLYRLGDSALRPMIAPYWISRGFTATEVGNVTTTLGMICVIAGAFAGGAFVMRFGIFRGLLWLGLLQMLSNLGYAYVAMTGAGRPAMYGAAIVETFCDGLGTAAFLSFLMFICEKENAATEYAMLSAVFAISRTLAGSVSGFFAQDLGYARYYWLTAALALPGLALLPLIRDRVRGEVTAAATDAGT
ncbi:MAG TPA: MFS transporter [Thermoanaerobaculia bacterium]|nr:MFS transporter [Thermoanaerobaculia bacterium]